MLGLLIAAALATGYPQKWLVERLAAKALGTRVEALGVTLVRRVHVDAIRVYDHDDDDPTVVLHDVSLALDLFAEDGRRIPEVRIGALETDVRAADMESSNIQFLQDILQRPADTPPNLTYIPRKIVVQSWSLNAQLAEMGLQLQPLALEAKLSAPGIYAVELASENVSGAHWFGSPDTLQPLRDGVIDVFAQQDADGMLIMADLALAPFLALAATATVDVLPGERVWSIDVETADIQGLALGGLDGVMLPVPVQFAVLAATDTHLTVRQAERLSLSSATLDVAARDLHVGPDDALWYGGDLAIQGSANAETDVAAELTLSLDAGQAVTLVAGGSAEAGTADIAIANWSRDELLDAVPPQFQTQAAALPPFAGLSGNLVLEWTGATYDLKSDFTTAAQKNEDTLALEIAGAGVRAGDGDRFTGNATLRIGQGEANATLTLPSTTSIRADGTVRNLDLNRWLRVFLGDRSPTLPDAQVDGDLALVSEALNEGADATLDLHLSGITLGERGLTDATPLDVSGAIAWDAGDASLASSDLHIQLPDRADIHIENWNHNIRTRQGKGAMNAHIELDWLEVGELWGNIDAHGPVTYAREDLSAPVSFTTENLGWGDLAIPYGNTIQGEGNGRMEFKTRTLHLAGVTAALDESNIVTIEDGEVVMSPLTAALPIRITTDLQPVVALGLLQTAQGAATFVGTAKLTDAGPSLEGDLTVDAASLVLPSNRAELRGLVASSSFAFTGGLEGRGEIAAASAVASSATMENLRSPIRWEGRGLTLPDLAGNAYGGTLTGTIRLGLLEEERPLEATVQFQQLDLKQFSDGVAPPDFSMTGLAHGETSVLVRAGTLAHLQFTAESTEDFSLSREMVQKILQSPRFIEMLGKKQLDKTVNTILGPAEQRPFERAAVTLSLDGTDTLKGEAVLESEKTKEYRGLDLTVDLDLPVTGLAELMALATGKD